MKLEVAVLEAEGVSRGRRPRKRADTKQCGEESFKREGCMFVHVCCPLLRHLKRWNIMRMLKGFEGYPLDII